MERLRRGVGAVIVETADDVLRIGTVRRMRATIGGDGADAIDGEPAPLMAHWLCFLPSAPMATLGEDGHPARAPSPLADLSRRMWAGSNITFHRPLRIGSALTRHSTTSAPSEKVGRGGRIAFVRVDHEVADAGGAVLSEAQDIVYRAAARPGEEALPAPQMAPADPEWARRVDPDPVLLFRYSALTFNAHRIHYDRRYAVEREGYPGLVVHGPLAATLLLHELLARHPGIDVATYRFRALRPLFDTGAFDVCGSLAADGVARLFARDAGGALCVDAVAALRP